ncbi:MAG: transcriptional repressor [Caldilineaceae bacterium]|nr:transcriptional repressor [Caldilineaceae bacterium]
MSHDTWDYVSFLREQGYRMTPQRQIIMDAICEGGTHSTLPQILERVQRKAPVINQATVYRSLHFLLNMGLIVKAEIAPGETIYEIAGRSPHHHLLCRVCHQEIEIDAQPLTTLQAELKQRYGFWIDASHLILTGLCTHCQAEQL